jgi:hypothetical protein
MRICAIPHVDSEGCPHGVAAASRFVSQLPRPLPQHASPPPRQSAQPTLYQPLTAPSLKIADFQRCVTLHPRTHATRSNRACPLCVTAAPHFASQRPAPVPQDASPTFQPSAQPAANQPLIAHLKNDPSFQRCVTPHHPSDPPPHELLVTQPLGARVQSAGHLPHPEVTQRPPQSQPHPIPQLSSCRRTSVGPLVHRCNMVKQHPLDPACAQCYSRFNTVSRKDGCLVGR